MGNKSIKQDLTSNKSSSSSLSTTNLSSKHSSNNNSTMYHRNTHHLRTGGNSVVFCCGYNSSSLLGLTQGDVDGSQSSTPYSSDATAGFVYMDTLQQLLNTESPGQHVCQVVVQFSKAYFLTSLGHVYTSSPLARDHVFDSILPDRVVEMRSGQNRTLFRTEFGQIYLKSDGPLTKITGSNNVNNVKIFGVGGLHYWLLDDETNRIYGEGEINGSSVEKVIELNDHLQKDEKVREIATGGNSFVLITNKNNIYVYGEKEAFGASIDESNYSKPTRLRQFDGMVKSVVCGWYYTVVLTFGGQLWMAGRNTYQQLSSKRQASNDNLVQWFLDTSLPLHPNEDIDQIGSGSDHILISTTDGRVFTRGMNTYGQLGRDNRNQSDEFIEPTFKTLNHEEIILKCIGTKYSISFADNNFNTLSSFLIIHSVRESKEVMAMRLKLLKCSNQALLTDLIIV